MTHHTTTSKETNPLTVNIRDRNAQVGDTVTINPAGITRTITEIVYTPKTGDYCIAQVREQDASEIAAERARQHNREQQKARREARRNREFATEGYSTPTGSTVTTAPAAERRVLIRVGEATVGDTINGRTITGLGRVWTIDSEENASVGAQPWETVRVQYAYF